MPRKRAYKKKRGHSQTPYGVTNRTRINCSIRRSTPGVVSEFAKRHNLLNAGACSLCVPKLCTLITAPDCKERFTEAISEVLEYKP